MAQHRKSKLVPGSDAYRPKILIGIVFCVGVLYLYIRYSTLSDETPSRDLQNIRSKSQHQQDQGAVPDTEAMALRAVEFEVFGRVQGVFFRKHTERQALKLKLVGWCMNTRSGTVAGAVQGPSDAVSSMKFWLQNTGSPQSKIDHAVFTNERQISQLEFDDFHIRH